MRIRKKYLSTLAIAAAAFMAMNAESLVILHTNDTHSQIEPDKTGAGGVLQRKAVIDSVRKAEKNVILVDAGDVVQGSLYFKFFKGDVENPLMDMMNYDIRILGNHEFDNGIEDIAKYYKNTTSTPLSTNYDFSRTVVDGIFSPYAIKKIGKKRVGFIGLNIDPSSLISSENTKGLRFMEIIPAANETAAFLKNDKHCDLVVAVTHIGAKKENEKTIDYDLARASKDIDIIIGGHSHTVIMPGQEGTYPNYVANADGKPVLIAQTGKYGKYLGYIKIDLDKVGKNAANEYDYRLIPVTDRFNEEVLDKDIINFLAPYKQVVDSVNSRVIARAAYSLTNEKRTGGFPNLAGDIAYNYAVHKADSLRLSNPDFPEIDFAIMNVGGIRLNMPEGDITEGQILSTFPFTNHLVIGEIKGRDLIDALKIAAKKGGEAVSGNLLVLTDRDKNVTRVLLDDYDVNPDTTYTYATIDYLIEGNDDLTPLAHSSLLWRDDVEVSAPILNYFERMGKAGYPIEADPRPRFVECEN